MKTVRTQIRDEVANIVPFDDTEALHRDDVLSWIDEGADLFRTESPDVPPKHLVSYFMLIDQAEEKAFLVHHKKANLWLLPGGHVDVDEHPRLTTARECQEELQIDADFWAVAPQFITVTRTVNTDQPHTDVSLWYALNGNVKDPALKWDEREFHDARWWRLDEILATPITTFDPHLHRFIDKMKATYAQQAAIA